MASKRTIHKYLLCIICAFFNLTANALDGQCRIADYPFSVSCTKLPASQSKPASSFDIQTFKVEARVRYPKPTPLIWIPDGLGVISSQRAPYIINALSRVRNYRDLIWLELKSGKGLPPLSCQTYTENGQNPSLAIRLYRANDDQLRRQCVHTLQALGGLKQFDYTSIAQAYERMAQHYGLKKVTVFAEGRGALIATAWQQMAPDRIAFQVFDSAPRMPDDKEAITQSLANEIALKKVFEACKASAACRQQFKHDMTDWLKLIQKLPVATTVKDPTTLQSTRLSITNDMLASWTIQLLRQPNKSRYLPLLLTHALTGDWQPMLGMLANPWQNKIEPFNHALAMAEQCIYSSHNRTSPQNKLSPIADWFYQSEQHRNQILCNDLTEYQPYPMRWHSETPTLMLIGMATPSTESSWQNTANLSVIKAPGAGHGLLSHACARDVVYRYFKFRDDSSTGKYTPPLDASCLSKIPYPHMEMRDPSTAAPTRVQQP